MGNRIHVQMKREIEYWDYGFNWQVEELRSLLTTREKSDLEIITKMYRQQKNHFQSKDCRESIPNRIVSISKPYVRPIVRGKEVKSVEKLSFNAFNEGTRLIHCLKMHKRLFGVEAKKVT